jgi:hypothetical protein
VKGSFFLSSFVVSCYSALEVSIAATPLSFPFLNSPCQQAFAGRSELSIPMVWWFSWKITACERK